MTLTLYSSGDVHHAGVEGQCYSVFDSHPHKSQAPFVLVGGGFLVVGLTVCIVFLRVT